MHLDLANSSQLYLGLWERELHSSLRRLSQGVATAIDVGASAGEYTLYFLIRTSANKVLAFEPDVGVWPQLSANLALNGVERDPRLQLSSDFVRSKCGPSASTLDSLVESIELPCLVKIDVDGGEAEILQGSGLLLRLPQVRWLIETHSRQLERDCMEILRASGFETRVIPNAWWRAILPEQRPVEHNRWLLASRLEDIW